MILTISGPAGSGKSSIGRLIAKKLGYQFYSVGDLRRKMALEHNMTLEEFNKLGEVECFTDRDADAYQTKIGETENNFIMESRLGWYFIKNSVKILVTANDAVAASRIFHDKNKTRINQQATISLEEQLKLCVERDQSDVRRYKKWYDIDNFLDHKHYDLVVDTSYENDIEKNAAKILDYLKDRKLL